jgi:hypothetical protein
LGPLADAGLPADGTIAAEVAFMFKEWYRPDCCLQFPRGGSQAIVQALVRCVHVASPPGNFLTNKRQQPQQQTFALLAWFQHASVFKSWEIHVLHHVGASKNMAGV